MKAETLRTLAQHALRPRLIWGPGDQQLLPRLQSGELGPVIFRRQAQILQAQLDDAVARHALARARAALGGLPTQRRLVMERFFDESGGMQLIIHSPLGSRVNRAWGLALRKRFCRSFNFELQAAATEWAAGFPITPEWQSLHPTALRSKAGLSMSQEPDGTITVPTGVTSGPATLTYQICETAAPSNCDTATVSLVLRRSPLVHADTRRRVEAEMQRHGGVFVFDQQTRVSRRQRVGRCQCRTEVGHLFRRH